MAVALERLLAHGEVYVDPLSVVVWEQADPNRPWLPPHMLSVPGLPRDGMLKLSRLDLARIGLGGVWLKGLMAAKVLGTGVLGRPFAEARLALQELREEAGNALMFVKLAELSSLSETAMARDLARLENLVGRLDAGRAGFWAWIYVGEAVTDALLLKALREGDDLCPVARQVMQLHHREQTRRLAACKTVLIEKLKTTGAVRRRAIALMLPTMLRRYLRAVLFPSADSLAGIGVANPHATARAVWNDHGRRALGSGAAASAVTVLRRAGLPIRAGASYPW